MVVHVTNTQMVVGGGRVEQSKSFTFMCIYGFGLD